MILTGSSWATCSAPLIRRLYAAHRISRDLFSVSSILQAMNREAAAASYETLRLIGKWQLGLGEAIHCSYILLQYGQGEICGSSRQQCQMFSEDYTSILAATPRKHIQNGLPQSQSFSDVIDPGYALQSRSILLGLFEPCI